MGSVEQANTFIGEWSRTTRRPCMEGRGTRTPTGKNQARGDCEGEEFTVIVGYDCEFPPFTTSLLLVFSQAPYADGDREELRKSGVANGSNSLEPAMTAKFSP